VVTALPKAPPTSTQPPTNTHLRRELRQPRGHPPDRGAVPPLVEQLLPRPVRQEAARLGAAVEELGADGADQDVRGQQRGLVLLWGEGGLGLGRKLEVGGDWRVQGKRGTTSDSALQTRPEWRPLPRLPQIIRLTQSAAKSAGDRPVEKTSSESPAKRAAHSRLKSCRRSWAGSSFWTFGG
jgi:hypothetical protein